jgi:hypothetical protein
MPFSLLRLFRPLAVVLAIGGGGVGATPASAMCGGNILLTCPPVAKTSPVVGSRAKLRKRRGASPKAALRSAL